MGDAKRWDLALINHDFEMTCKRFKNWVAIVKQNHDFHFENTSKRFKNWVAVAKRHSFSLPVTAIAALWGVSTCAAMGGYADSFVRNVCLFCKLPQPSPQSQFLSRCGGYRPLVESFLVGGSFEKANMFIIMMGCNVSMSFVMKTIRDKEDDVRTSMVAGFGYGVVISLVTGVRGPSVMKAGVMFALLNAGMHKAGIDVFRVLHADLDNIKRGSR